MDRHPRKVITTSADVRHSIEEEQNEESQGLPGRGLELREATRQMPLHFRIVDEEVVVFTIPHLTETGIQENAFLTKDTRLIERLRSIFDDYWTSAVEPPQGHGQSATLKGDATERKETQAP